MSNNPQSIEVQIIVNDMYGDDEILDNAIRDLSRELVDFGIDPEMPVSDETSSGIKGLDPVFLGILVMTITPTILTKFLEFLQTWAMRHENQTIKLKIMSEEFKSIEVEVPVTMSPDEVRIWVDRITNNTSRKRKHRR